MLDDEDPGWPLGKALILSVLPWVAVMLLRRQTGKARDGLILLRQVFLAFLTAILLFGVVLLALWPAQSTADPSPTLALVLIGLGVSSAVVQRFVEKPLDCTDDVKLADSYRTRFFRRIAMSEAAALFGFVGFFTASVWWVYPVGAAIALVGFARAAPTRRHLHRDQERLTEQSCFRSLLRALRTAPPAAR